MQTSTQDDVVRLDVDTPGQMIMSFKSVSFWGMVMNDIHWRLIVMSGSSKIGILQWK